MVVVLVAEAAPSSAVEAGAAALALPSAGAEVQAAAALPSAEGDPAAVLEEDVEAFAVASSR